MIENLENEHWLPIEDYEDLYQVSNYGRVKSLERKITHRNSLKTIKERILKQKTTKNGYQVVTLCKDGKQKMFFVHRLVASAFISNQNNYEQINHKDENKCNNHVENLEWCTAKYNVNYGARNKNVSKLLIGKNNPRSKQVIQLTLDNQFIRTWDSIREIERELGYNNRNICSCCKSRCKTSNGYKWVYA